MLMTSKITFDVLEALQHCRLKAYFALRGEEGGGSAYQELLLAQRAELRPKAIAKIERNYRKGEVVADLELSVANLRSGIPLSSPRAWRTTVIWSSSTASAGSWAPRSSGTFNTNQ
jgi:hypothetical protein